MTEPDQLDIAAITKTLLDIRKAKDDLEKSLKLFSGRVVTTKNLEISGSGRLKLKNLSADPTTGTVGELVVVNGKLKICTAATPTWTVVGTQT